MREVLATLGIIICTLNSQAQQYKVVPIKSALPTDNYCGLYCLYHAAKLNGQTLDLDKLFSRKYITGVFGSSADDLALCANEFGLKAEKHDNLTYTDAVILGQPIIILVRSHYESPLPSHWILFLDGDFHQAQIYDPSAGLVHVSAAELQSLWGNLAIHVRSTESASLWEPVAYCATKWLLIASALLVLLSMLYVSISKLHHGTLTVLMISVVITCGFHMLNPAGFLHNQDIVLRQLHVLTDRVLPHVKLNPTTHSLSEYIVVDSRDASQFRTSRLPGAINIPYRSSYWSIRKAVDQLDRNKPVLIYCLSEHCGWADSLGSSTLFFNFPKVSVLEGGLHGYTDAGGILDTSPLADNE